METYIIDEMPICIQGVKKEAWKTGKAYSTYRRE